MPRASLRQGRKHLPLGRSPGPTTGCAGICRVPRSGEPSGSLSERSRGGSPSCRGRTGRSGACLRGGRMLGNPASDPASVSRPHQPADRTSLTPSTSGRHTHDEAALAVPERCLPVHARRTRVGRIDTAIPFGLGRAPVGVRVAAHLVRVDSIARGGVRDAPVSSRGDKAARRGGEAGKHVGKRGQNGFRTGSGDRTG
jgi:hypothetical protein